MRCVLFIGLPVVFPELQNNDRTYLGDRRNSILTRRPQDIIGPPLRSGELCRLCERVGT